jgi:hypothetical protein
MWRGRFQSVSLLAGVALALCGPSCRSNDIQIVDMHGDLRDIWAGREVPETGKQADPNLSIVVDFSTSIDPARVSAQFVPADQKCGPAVAALVTGSVVPSIAWGTDSTDRARPSVPAPYNLLARKSITGVLRAAGPIAAGGEITLSDFSVNNSTTQPVGLIAGGKVTLVNGSVKGDACYGVASPAFQGASISGKQSQLTFDVARAFQDLETLATLLNEAPVTGRSVVEQGNLQLTGTRSGLNVFGHRTGQEPASKDVAGLGSTVNRFCDCARLQAALVGRSSRHRGS